MKLGAGIKEEPFTLQMDPKKESLRFQALWSAPSPRLLFPQGGGPITFTQNSCSCAFKDAHPYKVSPKGPGGKGLVSRDALLEISEALVELGMGVVSRSWSVCPGRGL